MMRTFLYDLGTVAARRPRRVLLIWLAVAVVVIAARAEWGGDPVNSFDIPGAESQRAIDLIEERFPGLTGTTSRIVFHSDIGGLDDPALASAIRESIDRARQLDDVAGVADPLQAGTFSADGRTAFATIDYSVRFDELTSAHLDAIRNAVAPAVGRGLQVEIGGAVADFGDEETAGNENVGLLLAVVVLIVALGSVTAMVLPIGLGVFALAVGTGLVGLLAAVSDVPEDTATLATMIGLGVGIDYALFILTRYRQLVHSGRSRPEAIAHANATAGQAVAFAGVTVLIAIVGLRVSGIPAIAMMGYGTAIVVGVSVAAAITLLPALLAMTGDRIDGLLARSRRRRWGSARKAESTIAGRWAHHVGQHPVRYMTVSLIGLLTLALPVTSLRIGFSDAGAETTNRTTRRAYDLLAEGFGPGFNGPLLVVADLTSVTDRPATVAELHRAVAQTQGIHSVAEPLISENGDAVIVTATPTSSPQDEATTNVIDLLRDDVLPTIEARSGATIMVGGSVAGFADVAAQLARRLPWFVGAVVLLSVLVLMLLFRSVVVPIKAALMNLLSIGAAYGFVVAVFQWGWGASLVGIDQTVPINPFVPMMMFAILFGLSMDYEVFLLSRVREEYQRTQDNHAAVVTALGATARVITSAALIMIAVFGGFVANPVTFVKMIGLGLSVAVLLDATVIRMVLVPSTMTLMGRANWWLPAWLERRLPNFEIERAHDNDENAPADQPAAA